MVENLKQRQLAGITAIQDFHGGGGTRQDSEKIFINKHITSTS